MNNNQLDISKIKKSELNRFVKNLIYTNKVMWDAICGCEEIVGSDIILSYRNEMDDNKKEEFLQRIAEIFSAKNKKYDTSMAESYNHF